jgi:hypothetical protein
MTALKLQNQKQLFNAYLLPTHPVVIVVVVSVILVEVVMVVMILITRATVTALILLIPSVMITVV